MGCFNIACSVSRLSLGYKTKVALIPLFPNQSEHPFVASKKEFSHEIDPVPGYLYPNELFTPASLPIFGEYNDYGTIENVERDANVEALESFFGISIESFLQILSTVQREWHSPFGGIMSAYAVDPSLAPLKKELDEDFLEKLGFIKTTGADGNDYFVSKRYEYKILLLRDGEDDRNNNSGFMIFDSQGRLTKEYELKFDAKERFLSTFHDLTGYYLNIAEEYHEKISILRQLSCMYVHREIFEELAACNVPNEYGEGKDSDKFKKRYNSFRERVIDHQKLKSQPPKKGDPDLDDLSDLLGPFSSMETGSFFSYFRDWPYFEEIYTQPIVDDSLRELFLKWVSFYFSMWSCNVHFSPAMNGEQHGNAHETKNLLEVSLRIIDRELNQEES